LTPVLSWLIRRFHARAAQRNEDGAEDRLALLAERSRLQELVDSYREFGFEALIPHCKERIQQLDGRLRRLQDRSRKD
jgi:hypothetical protein